MLSKQNWQSTFVGSKNVFEPDLEPKKTPAPTGKNNPEGSKKRKKTQFLANFKQKNKAVLPKLKLIIYNSRFQKCFEPNLDPKIKFQS